MKIYYWPSLDHGLYAAGHAIAVAGSFGEAVEKIAKDYSLDSRDKNILLSAECKETAIEDGFTFHDFGWD